MVAINMVSQQNDMLPEWKAKGKYTFPVLVTDEKDYWSTNPYGVRFTPTNLLLAADGKVGFRHLTEVSEKDPIMEAQIRELLGLSPFEERDGSDRTEVRKDR